MSDTNISIGTLVYNSNREIFGTVERVTDRRIFVNNDDRMIEIPIEEIDLQNSNHAELMLKPGFQPGIGMMELHTEELHAEVREVERGRVRIEKSVEHVPFHEDVELSGDVVEIEHVAGGQEFDVMPQPRQEGDKVIIPVVEEVVVLRRKFRVIEEIHVTTRRELHTERVEADLRREVVDVTYVEPDENGGN